MNTTTLREAIKRTMESVPNIGVVHDYERYADNQAVFRALYETAVAGERLVRGWFIRRVSRTETSSAIGRHTVTMTWLIQGYSGFVDEAESEKAFDALIDELVVAFRSDDTLGGTVASTVIDEEAGLQVEDAGPMMFAGVLCHSARCRLVTRHYFA